MRVLTFNLRHNNDYWEARKPLVIELIQELQPDVIGFQEVWMSIQQAHQILEAVDGNPYQIFVTPKQAHHSKEGIAIASRLPASNYETLDLPGGERVAQRINITLNSTQLCFVNTHLHHQPEDSEVERLPQMQAIVAWLNDVDIPIILTGDMNTIPESETIQLAKTRFASAYEQAHGHEPDYTFPAPLAEHLYPDYRTIDYIFISADSLVATTASIAGDKATGTNPILSPSDHRVIVADIVLKTVE